jgi:hypothetical protein
MYYKIDDSTIPLILTPDQYVTHKRNRDRLFNRLDEHGHQYTIVFVGYSLDDLDLRQALLSLSETLKKDQDSILLHHHCLMLKCVCGRRKK